MCAPSLRDVCHWDVFWVSLVVTALDRTFVYYGKTFQFTVNLCESFVTCNNMPAAVCQSDGQESYNCGLEATQRISELGSYRDKSLLFGHY